MDELQAKRFKKEFVDNLDVIKNEQHIESNGEIISNYSIFSKSIAVKYLPGHKMYIMENELEGLEHEDVLEFAEILDKELFRLKLKAEYRNEYKRASK